MSSVCCSVRLGHVRPATLSANHVNMSSTAVGEPGRDNTDRAKVDLDPVGRWSSRSGRRTARERGDSLLANGGRRSLARRVVVRLRRPPRDHAATSRPSRPCSICAARSTRTGVCLFSHSNCEQESMLIDPRREMEAALSSTVSDGAKRGGKEKRADLEHHTLRLHRKSISCVEAVIRFETGKIK